MKIRLVYPAAAVLAAGLFLISCSGDSGSDEGGEPIDGTQTGTQENLDGEGDGSQSPEATPSDDGIERPEIELPDDMNNVFDDTETGNETQDAIIADVTRWIEAMDMGFAAGDPQHEAIEFYATGEGLVSSRQYVRSSSDAGLSWAGTAVYYDFVVNNEGDEANRPIVSYCNDITELSNKDLETGETLPPEVEDPQYFLHSQVVVRQNDQGVWQVERVLPGNDELDRECER